MAGRGYIGDSDSDRAFEKMEKFLKKIQTTDSQKENGTFIDKTFELKFEHIYASFGTWRTEVYEFFKNRYNVSIDARMGAERFDVNPSKFLREQYDNQVLPKNAAKNLSIHCLWL